MTDLYNPDADAALCLNWLLYHCLDRDAEAVPAIIASNRLMAEKRYDELDLIFESAQTDFLSVAMIITLLRTTYAGRQHLSAWEGLRDRAHVSLAKRGRDPQRVLMGLFSA